MVTPHTSIDDTCFANVGERQTVVLEWRPARSTRYHRSLALPSYCYSSTFSCAVVRRRHMNYWWRSRFSRFLSGKFKLSVSVVFDFDTSIEVA